MVRRRTCRGAPDARRAIGPSRFRPASRRPGFGLIEVIVALAVLAVGVLGTVGTAHVAARGRREAEARERAAALAGELLDSLAFVASPVDGDRWVRSYRGSWAIRPHGGGRVVELVVEYRDGTADRHLRIHAFHTPPPPRLEDSR